MKFVESFFSVLKMVSMVIGMLALVWFISVGFGVTYELFAGHVPGICKVNTE